ncbi:hypothetical protein KCU73_g73, partial [Aureobasidium melanogenum]
MVGPSTSHCQALLVSSFFDQSLRSPLFETMSGTRSFASFSLVFLWSDTMAPIRLIHRNIKDSDQSDRRRSAQHKEEAQKPPNVASRVPHSACEFPVEYFDIQASRESRTVGEAMIMACRRSCKMHVRETFNMREVSSRVRQMQSPMKPAAPPTPSTPPLWVMVRVQHHTQE